MVEENKYTLIQELEGPYYQPYPVDSLPDDGDWEKMPRKNRPQSEVQYQRSVIQVQENDGSILVDFSIDGTDAVPVAIELSFREGGVLHGVSPVEDIPKAYLLKDGLATYVVGNDEIEFGPGRNQHLWTQLRGAHEKVDGHSVYVTGFTPFEYRLEIR